MFSFSEIILHFTNFNSWNNKLVGIKIQLNFQCMKIVAKKVYFGHFHQWIYARFLRIDLFLIQYLLLLICLGKIVL